VNVIDPSTFPVVRKWPPIFFEHIQLYSLPTPSGVKVAIMFKKIGLIYEAHRISFGTNDQDSPEFKSLSPNSKIPASSDPNGHPWQAIRPV
jgi:GST-like protein